MALLLGHQVPHTESVPNSTIYGLVAAYKARVASASGALEGGIELATANLVAGLKADGIWDGLARANLLVGGLNGSAIPLVSAKGATADTLTSFVAGDYSLATGLTGGTSRVLKSGVLPFTDIGPTGFLGVYVRTTGKTSQIFAGTRDSGSTQLYRIRADSSGHIGAMWGGPVTPNEIFTSSAYGAGWWVVERSAFGPGTSVLKLYYNGAVVLMDTTDCVPGSPGNQMYVFGQNSAGSATSLYTGSLGGYLMGPALGDAGHALLYAEVQKFMTAARRSV